MTGWFVDASVLSLAAGLDHPDKASARAFLDRAVLADGRLHASVEAAQEFIYHRMRRTARSTALRETRRIVQACVMHPFDDEVLDLALVLIETSQVRGRDAVHAATALIAGFDAIVSLDADFDEVPGLTRIHPADAV